jgi:DMSO reductase anchor subunit
VKAIRILATGGAIGALLWLMLDSGRISPDPSPPGMSAALGTLGVLFGFGAVVMHLGGQPERMPLLAGLALGVGGYAIARLFAF